MLALAVATWSAFAPAAQSTIGGDLEVLDARGTRTAFLNASAASSGSELSLFDLDASGGPKLSIELDTREGAAGGAIRMYNGVESGAHLNQATVEINAGEADHNPQIVLFDDQGRVAIELDARKNDGHSRISADVVQINGGLDLAERFRVTGEECDVQPGMVVSVDLATPGDLTISRTPYDTRVAGIISGAGGIRPAMLMGPMDSPKDPQYPIALCGRVYVFADASEGAIQPGDLLTTSATPGHAMRVADRAKAHGAVLGKAMSGLEGGKGQVLVLVGLQ